MEIIIYAFIEHELIPPTDGSYTQELGNFFSILMADPVQYVFKQHLKILYRRGWRKNTLARKACFALVEHYVALVMMVVQQALMQNECTLSRTPSFVSSVQHFVPMTKIQEVLRSLLLTFDPISYLPEEAMNREAHERKFQHHFGQYSNYVSEIIDSYEFWLQETVDAYRTGLQIPRRELFLRVIGAGGYDESRTNYLESVATVSAETDEATQSTQTNDQFTQYNDDKSGEELKRIEVTVKNTGSVPLSGPAVLSRSAIVITTDGKTSTRQLAFSWMPLTRT